MRYSFIFFILLYSSTVLSSEHISAQGNALPLPEPNPMSFVPEAKTSHIPVRNPKRLKKQVKPNEWPASEIAKAKAYCAKVLQQTNTVYEFIPPIKKGVCGDPAPIKLISIGSNPAVKILPPAKINCRMVVALHKWLNEEVQPQAKSLFNSEIIGIQNVASYACRHRYGNPNKRMSEHAFLNALDIAGFVTQDKRYISLLADWGPTKREILGAKLREQFRLALQKKVAEAFAEWKKPKVQQFKNQQHSKTQNSNNQAKQQKLSALGTSFKEHEEKKAQWQTTTTSAVKPARYVFPLPEKKPRQKRQKALAATSKSKISEKHDRKKEVFLKNIHKGACGIFTTVLGPESNDAHKNHFHFDLITRKYKAFCE